MDDEIDVGLIVYLIRFIRYSGFWIGVVLIIVLICFCVGGKKEDRRAKFSVLHHQSNHQRLRNRKNLTTHFLYIYTHPSIINHFQIPFDTTHIHSFQSAIATYIDDTFLPSFKMISFKSIAQPQIVVTLTIIILLQLHVTPNHAFSTPTPKQQLPQSQSQPQHQSQPSPEVKRLLQNLQSISTHLQNPDLYSTSWANNVSVVSSKKSSSKRKSHTTGNENDDYCLIASKHIQKGELITLYPIHAIGIKSKIDNKLGSNGDGDDMDNDNNQKKKGDKSMGMKSLGNKKNTKKKLRKQQIQRNKHTFLESYDYLYHDSKWNLDDTIPSMKEYQHEVQIPFGLSSTSTSSSSSSSVSSESSVSSTMMGVHPLLCQYEHELYIQSHPTRRVLPGWYGHLIQTKQITTTSSTSKRNLSLSNNKDNHNCMIVPIPCSIPLCGVVATRDIEKGEQIVRQVNNNNQEEQDKVVLEFVKQIIQRYTAEITELGSYYQMAYDAANNNEEEKKDEMEHEKLQSSSFHTINESYPNLTKLHTNPDIYIIPDFLSSEECDRLIQKASTNLQPCLIKTEESGQVQLHNNIRTSTNANIPRGEVPSITQKIQNLIQFQSEDQLEIYQVLKYDKGQEFKPHTDGFDKPVTACGFFQSGRIVTLFTYLNDVEEGSGGGQTVFTKLGSDGENNNNDGLKITPRKGMAVIHFPMTLDLVEDKRTEHEGSMAIDEKWILTTWVWKDERLDERYAEDHLESASDDII